MATPSFDIPREPVSSQPFPSAGPATTHQQPPGPEAFGRPTTQPAPAGPRPELTPPGPDASGTLTPTGPSSPPTRNTSAEPDRPRVAPDVDPLLLGPPLFAQQNRPLDAPRFTPSPRPENAAANGTTPHQAAANPAPRPHAVPQPGPSTHPDATSQPRPHNQPGPAAGHPGSTHQPRSAHQPGPAAQLGPAAQADPAAQPGSAFQPGRPDQPSGAPQPAATHNPGPAQRPDTAQSPAPPTWTGEVGGSAQPDAPQPGLNDQFIRAPQPTGTAERHPNAAGGPGQQAHDAHHPRPAQRPDQVTGPGPHRPGEQPRQSNRPPLEPPQMGQLNRPLDPATQSPPPSGQQPGHPVHRSGQDAHLGASGHQPGGHPAHQPGPAAHHPGALPGHAGTPAQQPPAAPGSANPQTGHPAQPGLGAPSGLGRAQPAPRPQRPPLEPPQLGQLNRPLPPQDASDVPSGLPLRPDTAPAPAAWSPAGPAGGGAEAEEPSGLPHRPARNPEQNPDN